MRIILLLLICFAFKCSYAQLQKGTWLIGGSGSFSSAKYNTPQNDYNVTSIALTPEIGYFFTHKFISSLKPLYNFQLTDDKSENSISEKIEEYGLGVSLGYYLLNKEQPFNILSKLEYSYSLRKSSNTTEEDRQNTYGISGGPVYFINQSIGINIMMGYSLLKYNNNEALGNRFSTSLGFQIHLTKK